MFKKTRYKICILIMSVATVILVLMLSIIYIANVSYSYERGISLLESYLEKEMDDPRPGPDIEGFFKDRPDKVPGMKDKQKQMFHLSTFYSVHYDTTGQVVMVDTNDGLLYSEEEITGIADQILSSGKLRGRYNKMPFLVRHDDMGTVVALIDHTMEMDNFNKLFDYSLAAGAFAWLVIFILSWFFSKRIVSPLEENDKKQKQFISDAGHELKTPISVISANADLLALEMGENKWLSNIQYENERMGKLVKQLLELARAENKTMEKARLDFSYLLSGSVLPFECLAFEKGMILNAEIDEGIYVNGNENQLSQLISILIDNAIEHGSMGKEVLVKLSSLKHQAVLSVINEGEPISAEQKERLFERFYRMDEARSSDTDHYGLGLAIAKAIVLSHDGKIEVDSYDGLVAFRVTLPKV